MHAQSPCHRRTTLRSRSPPFPDPAHLFDATHMRHCSPLSSTATHHRGKSSLVFSFYQSQLELPPTPLLCAAAKHRAKEPMDAIPVYPVSPPSWCAVPEESQWLAHPLQAPRYPHSIAVRLPHRRSSHPATDLSPFHLREHPTVTTHLLNYPSSLPDNMSGLGLPASYFNPPLPRRSPSSESLFTPTPQVASLPLLSPPQPAPPPHLAASRRNRPVPPPSERHGSSSALRWATSPSGRPILVIPGPNLAMCLNHRPNP
jgi:hypothetical protein